MDGGSAGFAGAKTCRFLFSDRLLAIRIIKYFQ
jgi:hypothetical protein